MSNLAGSAGNQHILHSEIASVSSPILPARLIEGLTTRRELGKLTSPPLIPMRLAARGSYTGFPTPSSGLEAEVNHLWGILQLLSKHFCKLGLSQCSPLKSKSVCIEHCSTLAFGVGAPARMRHMCAGFGLLSHHEMYDRARPGRSEYCCIPTVSVTIGEPCERRQCNERYTSNGRAGGRNVSK